MESVQQLCFGPFRFDPDNQCLWRGEHMLGLAPKPFALLAHLIIHPGRLVTKEELLLAVWPTVCVADSALKVCVREVRKVLGDPAANPLYIQTSHRRGYRFIAPLTPPLKDAQSTPHAPWQPESSPGLVGLVGRDAVLAQLHDHLQLALQGERQCVLLSGEAGIGKTAILDAVLAQVTSKAHILTLCGQCVQLHGTAEPYLPVLHALSQLCRQPGAENLPELLKRYAPTWLSQLPWLLEDSDNASQRHQHCDIPHARMLREMGELCCALARQTPLVLVVENLQYADYSTLDLLAWLAVQHETARLMVVGTYRPAELLFRAQPLQAVIQQMELPGHCTELALGALSVNNVDELLQQRFPDHDFPDALSALLWQRSDGNPLFLNTMVDELLERGMLVQQQASWRLTCELVHVQTLLPQRLRHLIDKQLDRLSVEQQQVLTGASIAGTKFTASTLAFDHLEDLSCANDYC